MRLQEGWSLAALQLHRVVPCWQLQVPGSTLLADAQHYASCQQSCLLPVLKQADSRVCLAGIPHSAS